MRPCYVNHKPQHISCKSLQKLPEDDKWFCDKCADEKCGTCNKGPLNIDDHILCGDELIGDKHKGCDKAFHMVTTFFIQLFHFICTNMNTNAVSLRNV